MDSLPTSVDTTLNRMPDRQVLDRAALHALLDEELIAHVSAVVRGQALTIPMAFARDGDGILLHLSTGAGTALRAGGDATPLTVSVCAVDALVYATTLYDSSMNYRSAVIHGVPEALHGSAKEAALAVIADKLMPGRAAEVPENSRRELAGTLVLRVPITTVSMKARAGDPSESDRLDDGAWAGLLPAVRTWGAPVTASFTPAGIASPPSVTGRSSG
ncbi:pyridoxamine 5'-phosphate oxidase family protein [Glaciibacter flavus]|uniref:Pyridoxamine 5'-phosphate oxidase family protein n=1 Tax=Orlajensenia flava TaxID=2565934 RepID=A0A4S4G088_9MICO|nr:pyridoxamine 5'-phosphate oxidase family protein [Glaciibacter flavus]THG36138.1 pyridoxamine 5'-phosphate oxidase family protein [Glaciibacter flavus]